MTVQELIAILQTKDQTAEVVLVEAGDTRCIRDLTAEEIHGIVIYRPHPDRWPTTTPQRRGPKYKAVQLGGAILAQG